METKEIGIKPDYCTHPGEILEEIIEAKGIAKGDLAKRTGLTVKTISQIINGKAPISSDTAIALEHALGISAETWNALDSQYRLFQARKGEEDRLAELTEWAGGFPLKDLKTLTIIRNSRDKVRTTDELLSFFGVSSVEVWKELYLNPAVTYKRSKTLVSSPEAVAAWLRIVELKAMEIETEAFSAALFKKGLTRARVITKEPPETFEPELKELCRNAGIALVIEAELSDTRLSGATRWLNRSKALLALSVRHKSDDHFWFSFFHEAGHILLHGRDRTFIDEPDVENDRLEEEADTFARDFLLPPKEYEAFLKKGDFFPQHIHAFAKEQGIAPGIIVGFLQHDGYIEHSWHNGLKRRFELVRADR